MDRQSYSKKYYQANKDYYSNKARERRERIKREKEEYGRNLKAKMETVLAERALKAAHKA